MPLEEYFSNDAFSYKNEIVFEKPSPKINVM